jgi:glucoamylase
MEPLDRWIERQYRHSALALMRSISPLGTVKHRPGFGQTVVPRKGSIVASPVLGAYDPDPDYFFHWYRDSAVVMDALRLVALDTSIDVGAAGHFADFVDFSISLQKLDGRERVTDALWRGRVAEDYRQFTRSDADLAGAHGDAVAAETRVNPDGTLDISKWPRPQNDGPPLRALTLMRWLADRPPGREVANAAASLLRVDLAFTLRRWREPSFDIWEEDNGHHYYTLRVAAAALEKGAIWFQQQGESPQALRCQSEAAEILDRLDTYWHEDSGFYKSRVLENGAPTPKELDISVIFAALHGGAAGAGASLTHSVHDPRMHATLARLEALFDAEYAINRKRSASRAPAMGRYSRDVYFSGGAYYFSTLAAAEFCFRAAQGTTSAPGLLARGDAFLETVRAYTPPSGELSEQFDQNSGVQTSAKQLAWSYAAFISCAAARRETIRRIESA